MKRYCLIIATVAVVFAAGFSIYFQVYSQPRVVGRDLRPVGPETNATVSFGAWMTDPPLDRFPNDPAAQFPIPRNHHRLVPELAHITAGGTVNFIIGGFHVVAVYDDGTLPGDIDTSLLQSVANPPGPPIINDPDRRIYRGLDPSTIPRTASQDRVEVVHFPKPGLYLVICAVLPHFQEGMYGYVRVTGPPRGILGHGH